MGVQAGLLLAPIRTPLNRRRHRMKPSITAGGRRMSGERKSDTARTVVGRVIAILGCFSPTQQSLGLVEISRRTGLPVSTVFRLVGELRECGAGRAHG